MILRKLKKHILFIIAFAFCFNIYAQVAAPSLRCLSVANNAAGDITLTWVIPADPLNEFTSYQIYNSPTFGGTYNFVGTVNTYSQNTYIHAGANGNVQSQYYYIKTVSNGTVTSSPSDTLKSLFLNFTNLPSGIASLSWNKTRNSLLPSASTSFTVSRENPPNPWNTIYTGSNTSLKDTINICSIFYNYKVETSDASGCISVSNIQGDLFQDANAPTRPVLDSVSVIDNTTTVLGWQPSAQVDVIGYVVYEINSLGILVPIDTVLGYNNTAYTYTAAASGSQAQTFCITALDSCGNLSIPSVTHKTMLLNSSYDLCSRSVHLSWTAYGNLPGGPIQFYSIYCSANGGQFVKIGNTKNITSFIHQNVTPGVNYTYYIRVFNALGNISSSSNSITEFAKAPQSPSYVYLRSVSVNQSKQVEIKYAIDSVKVYKGAAIFKSEDGITFNQIGFNSASPASRVTQTYLDTDVSPTEKNYYYKILVIDSCGNPGSYSNISKTVVLKVKNEAPHSFNNDLTWDDYSSWSGNVSSYNIYRAVNGVFDPIPVANVNGLTLRYKDNVQHLVSEQGKISYYVEAVEGTGNVYGFSDVATSNTTDAYVEAEIYVPNAFAPNGVNNVWLPVTQFVEKTDYKVMVFDRWGTKVFQTNSDQEGWSGKGTTDDTFVYFIEYKNARGEFIQLKGHLILLK